MTDFQRYAVYYTPPPGAFADAGAQWLGWDVAAGRAVAQPAMPGPDMGAITETPRKYGFHATIKPPFGLGPDHTAPELLDAFRMLCAVLSVARAQGLMITPLGRFLALTLAGDSTEVDHLAATAVRELDRFRAPMDDAERTRRTRPGMSAAQLDNLTRWGYPHVMDSFRFHMTLTGRVDRAVLRPVLEAAQTHLHGVLPVPFRVEALSLMGQRRDGMFVQIERRPLTG